jgi:hypothetical protein
MKKTILALALLSAGAVFAQTDTTRTNSTTTNNTTNSTENTNMNTNTNTPIWITTAHLRTAVRTMLMQIIPLRHQGI